MRPMGDDLPGFRLRDLAADDGPAVAAPFDAGPDTGMFLFRPCFQADLYVARAPEELRADHPIEPVP